MSEAWAQELERVLVEAGRHVVRVIEAEARRPLDALCVVVDSGSCWFAWDEAPVGWVPDDPLPPRDGKSPSGFTVPDVDLPEVLAAALVDVGDTYAARYDAAEVDGVGAHAEEQLDAGVESAAAAALTRLGPDLARLDRTPGFVAHVVRFDGRWPEESVRRTVGEDLVQRRFPGFEDAHRRDVELGELSSGHGPRALLSRMAEVHAAAVEDLDVDTVAAIDRELVGNGRAAVAPVLDAVDRHARQPQFTSPGTPERQHVEPWTPAHRLAAHLLVHVLPRLWGVHQPEVEERLVELGRWLHDHPEWRREAGRDAVLGPNESLVARTLHALWPDRYPSVAVSHATNEVHNAAEYGFTTTDSGPA